MCPPVNDGETGNALVRRARIEVHVTDIVHRPDSAQRLNVRSMCSASSNLSAPNKSITRWLPAMPEPIRS